MLVLTRSNGQSIQIGNNIQVSVTHVSGGQVKIAVDAPKDVKVLRTELIERALKAP